MHGELPDERQLAEFETLEDAHAWADADPYVVAGVYGDVTIKPFKKVFG